MNPPGEQTLATIDAPRRTSEPLGERLAATPRLACEALTKALNGGDLEAALACFAPSGCLIGPDGATAQGESALAHRLGGLLARHAEVEIELFGVTIAGDLALAHERWAISYGGRIDSRAAKAVSPTMVLRLIAGEWKLAIAAPWGVRASEPLRAIWP